MFFWVPNQFLPITDATKVKDFLVLECPSLAPDILSRMFSNQIATCNEVRGYDEAEEHNAGEVSPSISTCSIRSMPTLCYLYPESVREGDC